MPDDYFDQDSLIDDDDDRTMTGVMGAAAALNVDEDAGGEAGDERDEELDEQSYQA